MVTPPDAVIGGIDSHAETIHVAAISTTGNQLADAEFPTTADGYRDALRFLASGGAITAIGIEGTSSYGAGITAAALKAGLKVIEVNRPDRAHRRRRGKSDPIDAYQAAQAVLSGRASSAPKAPETEGLRALHNARRSAVKARTAAMNQITALLITAPEPLRAKYRDLQGKALLAALVRARRNHADPTSVAVITALRALAARHRLLTEQINELSTAIDQIVTETNAGLRAVHGVGPDTAAQLLITAGANPDRLRTEASFAALCGAAPIPASSGKTTRHRLSRGGDRQANSALHRIALVRMGSEIRTRDYIDRQTARGKTKTEILRQLKRAIAREIYHHLTRPVAAPDYSDLRPARHAKNITLATAAEAFNVWPAAISTLERGVSRDDDLAEAYRRWLAAA